MTARCARRRGVASAAQQARCSERRYGTHIVMQSHHRRRGAREQEKGGARGVGEQARERKRTHASAVALIESLSSEAQWLRRKLPGVVTGRRR
jgi:hypothetical protein